MSWRVSRCGLGWSPTDVRACCDRATLRPVPRRTWPARCSTWAATRSAWGTRRARGRRRRSRPCWKPLRGRCPSSMSPHTSMTPMVRRVCPEDVSSCPVPSLFRGTNAGHFAGMSTWSLATWQEHFAPRHLSDNVTPDGNAACLLAGCGKCGRSDARRSVDARLVHCRVGRVPLRQGSNW